MVTKTFFADLSEIMEKEETRTGLLRVGVYTAGVAVLAAVAGPAAAGALDMTSVASVYGANLWAAGQYPYLSPDFIATQIQDGQQIFGNQAFDRFAPDRPVADGYGAEILQQCRDTVTKVRAVTPNEAWMRILDTASYALDKIEGILKPGVDWALETKAHLSERYTATKEVGLAAISVIALGFSLRDKFRKAANMGRKLFGLPEKLSAEEQALADLSDAMMADMARSNEELSAGISERMERMERQIIETLKEQISEGAGQMPIVQPGVCAETADSIRIDPQTLLNANIAANVALTGAEGLRNLDMKEDQIQEMASKTSGILWMSDALHERMNEIAGKAVGGKVDVKSLRGDISANEIIREGRRKLKFSVNRSLHQELLANGVSTDRLAQIVEQCAGAAKEARAKAEIEQFLSVMDHTASKKPKGTSSGGYCADQEESIHISLN